MKLELKLHGCHGIGTISSHIGTIFYTCPFIPVQYSSRPLRKESQGLAQGLEQRENGGKTSVTRSYAKFKERLELMRDAFHHFHDADGSWTGFESVLLL